MLLRRIPLLNDLDLKQKINNKLDEIIDSKINSLKEEISSLKKELSESNEVIKAMQSKASDNDVFTKKISTDIVSLVYAVNNLYYLSVGYEKSALKPNIDDDDDIYH
jgi:predicted nuclease with TOPRIM domain